ncbi:MAG TPA: TIGR04066 family peptide maturation system protein [Bacillota bacterium]|nr:TIGR04066 family peptide maturation system protein [Bacillota bacterium]
MTKQRIIIYPFDMESMPFVRHATLLNDELVGLAAPTGWGFCGKDASVVDHGEPVNLRVSPFEEIVTQCDTVFLVEPARKLNFTEILKPKIFQAIAQGKNIISALNLSEVETQEIREECRRLGVQFSEIPKSAWSEKEPPPIEEVFKINTPVIFVLGIAERTQKFEIQLTLREKLLQQGYRVSQIGSRTYCDFLNFHAFPAFMFQNGISESQKITLFNHYIKTIELEEKPDVIVLGVPGGLMPFNDRFTNRFGVLAYEVSQAITPDAAVVSLLYEDFTLAYFEELSLHLKYKFGFEIDAYHMANMQFDWASSQESKKMQYTTLSADFIAQKLLIWTPVQTPLFNVLNPGDGEKMVDLLVNKLSVYEEVQSI